MLTAIRLGNIKPLQQTIGASIIGEPGVGTARC
jgi:hypothetical protein